jgi:hypothetical protein
MTESQPEDDQTFVFTKPGTEAGETLLDILSRKEDERLAGKRLAGKNVFWWGVGNSLGNDLQAAAIKAGGILPVIFVGHDRPTTPKDESANPGRVVRWTKWKSKHEQMKDVPAYAKVRSRWDEKKKLHFALVCECETPLSIDPNGLRFDPTLCRTFAAGRTPGTSQITALVRGNLRDPGHRDGRYRIFFRASLVAPWQAKLIQYE